MPTDPPFPTRRDDAAAGEPRARTSRSDGGQTRERLVAAGLRLFAAHGYKQASIRDIAEAAQVNVAAISYHFGDKAGLYRAVFFEPLDMPVLGDAPGTPWPDPRSTPLPAVLAALFEGLMAPLRHGEAARLCMQLHFREMLEPTGLWDEEIEREIRPMHEALVAALVHHYGLPEPDDEVVRLALAIAGLGVHLHVAADAIDRLAPQLSVTAASVSAWAERLVLYATAMVDAEAGRRGLAVRIADLAGRPGPPAAAAGPDAAAAAPPAPPHDTDTDAPGPGDRATRRPPTRRGTDTDTDPTLR